MLNKSTHIAAAAGARMSGVSFASRRLTRASGVALLALSLPFVGSHALAQGLPGGEYCDDLDPSGNLFSTCIQAHSAANREEHLIDVGANEQAVARAKLALDEALATYAGLPGGGTVPGFEAPPPPILAVAYINRDADPAYNAENDNLIAKITDDNNDGAVSEGDIITTARYPVNFAANSEEFTNPLSAPITWASVSPEGDSVNARSTDDSGDIDGWRFQFLDDAPVPPEVACLKDEYSENGNRAQAVIRDLFETDTDGCVPTGQQDRLQVDSGVPSGGPILGISLFQLPSGSDLDFINVVITK